MGMSEKEQTLTLSPRNLRLTVDGTAVDCRDWDVARKILANQARIHHRPVTVTVTDPEPAVTGQYTFDQDGHLLDATGGKDQPATMTLHEWVLQIPGHGAATFTELTTATARIEALAEATNTAITVTIEGAAPGGALTERYTPADPDESPQDPDDTHDPETAPETDFDAELAQLLLAEPNSDTGTLPASQTTAAPEAAPGGESETATEATGSPALEPSEDQIEHPEDSALDLFTAEAAEDEAEPQESQSPKLRRRLVAVSAAAAALLLIAGIGVTTAIRSLPGQESSTAASAASATAWGQEVSANSTPTVSLDHQRMAVTDDQGLTFVDLTTGETIHSVNAVLTDRTAYPYGTSGFYITGSEAHAPMICEQPEESDYTCQDVKAPEGGQKLIHRAGTIAYSADKDVVILNDGAAQTTFHAPDKNAAFAAVSDSMAVWATATKKGEGSLAYATANGAVKKTVDLVAPAKDAKILSWIGPTDHDQVAMLWSGHDGEDRLVLHDRQTGKPTTTTEIPTGASGNIGITDTGSLILAGDRAITSTGKAVDISKAKNMKTSGDVITNGETTVTGTGELLTETPSVVTTTDHGPLVVTDSRLRTLNND